MAQEFIANPTRLIRQLLPDTATSVDFEAGRAAMACEIVTLIRTLESFEDMLPAEHSASLISVLQTLISDQQMSWVYGVYDALSANRRPVFVPEPELSGTVDADAPDERGLRLVPSSVPEALRDAPSPVDALRALSVVRQSQDASTIDEQLELIDGEAEEKSSA
jgi:hypothetical protein